MIRFKLTPTTESLKPQLQDLLIYSGITNVVVEIGKERTASDIFINESECSTLEDVLSKFALQIYDENVHHKGRPSSVISLHQKHGASAQKIAMVIEKAIEPSYFFALDRIPLA